MSSQLLLAKETQFVSNVPMYVDPTFPKIELGKFNGNLMHYVHFVKTFEANVESRITDPNKQLLLLVQHCEGEAKKVIDHCLLLRVT